MTTDRDRQTDPIEELGEPETTRSVIEGAIHAVAFQVHTQARDLETIEEANQAANVLVQLASAHSALVDANYIEEADDDGQDSSTPASA